MQTRFNHITSIKKKIRRRKQLWIMIALLIVPMTHLIYNFNLRIQFKEITEEKIITLGKINCGNNHNVELSGVYGNVFDPKKDNPDINYDLVPVTCVMDPISILENKIIWENNFLLRSALLNTFTDSVTFRKTVDELITTMSANGELIKYFLFTPPSSYKIDKYELRKKGKVYFWDISKESKYYEKTRILKMLALPLFNPANINQDFDYKKRLKDNLKLSIKHLFHKLKSDKNHEINSIGFAALAGTTRMMDSHYFLDYKDSFFTIYDGLKSSNIPVQIDRIYFVVYDNLSIKEEHDALNGLFILFRHLKHFHLGVPEVFVAPHIVRALPFTLIFIILYIITYKNIKTKDRSGLLLRVSEIFTVMLSVIAVIFHYMLVSMKYNFFLCFLGELIISFLLFRIIVWLNKIRI